MIEGFQDWESLANLDLKQFICCSGRIRCKGAGVGTVDQVGDSSGGAGATRKWGRWALQRQQKGGKW